MTTSIDIQYATVIDWYVQGNTVTILYSDGNIEEMSASEFYGEGEHETT